MLVVATSVFSFLFLCSVHSVRNRFGVAGIVLGGLDQSGENGTPDMFLGFQHFRTRDKAGYILLVDLREMRLIFVPATMLHDVLGDIVNTHCNVRNHPEVIIMEIATT